MLAEEKEPKISLLHHLRVYQESLSQVPATLLSIYLVCCNLVFECLFYLCLTFFVSNGCGGGVVHSEGILPAQWQPVTNDNSNAITMITIAITTTTTISKSTSNFYFK